MRVLITLLVLGNIALFAALSGWLSSAPNEREAGGGSAALSPDRIEIVSRGDPPPLVPKPPPERCVEWSPIARSLANQIVEAGEGTGVRFVRRELRPAPVRWWVMIPPASKAAQGSAEKKMAELKKLGITNFTLIKDAGPDQFAVFLGEFEREADAGAALDKLRKKGVRSAKVLRRLAGEAEDHLWVRGLEEMVVRLRSVLPGAEGVLCSDAAPEGAAAPAALTQDLSKDAASGLR